MPNATAKSFATFMNNLPNAPQSEAAPAVSSETGTNSNSAAPLPYQEKAAPISVSQVDLATVAPGSKEAEASNINLPATNEELSAVQPESKPEAVAKKGRAKVQKEPGGEKKKRGTGVTIYLPESVHRGLKLYCITEEKTIDAYFHSIHDEARLYTYACAENGCKQKFVMRISDEGIPAKPNFCPVCGSKRIRPVKTY